MTIKIELAKDENLEDLVIIEKSTFDNQKYHLMTKTNFKHLINKGNADILIAKKNEKSCALAVVFYKRNSTYGRLYSIAVLPEFQGKDIGRILYNTVEERIRKKKLSGITLEIRADNTKHKKRYTDIGFKLEKILPQYYPDKSNGLKLKKNFK
jgi:ribosomal protein S18 acetylase RimI-like enzyme